MPNKNLKQIMKQNPTLDAYGFSGKPSARALLSKYHIDFEKCRSFLKSINEHDWLENISAQEVLGDFNKILVTFEEHGSNQTVPIGVVLAAAFACGCEITGEEYMISSPADETGGGIF